MMGRSRGSAGILAGSASIRWKELEMTRVEELEAEIEKLSPAELAELRDWLIERDWDQWDRQIEADAAAGKLGKLKNLFDQALAAHQAGESTEL